MTVAAGFRRRRDAIAADLPRFAALAFWVLLPVLCLVALGVGADKLARHLDRPLPGIQGSYVVTSRSCQRELCITTGTFTSADRTIREPDLLGDYRWRVGQTHKVVYEHNAADVIPFPARWDPTSTFAGMAGAVAFLAVWAWCVRNNRKNRSNLRSTA